VKGKNLRRFGLHSATLGGVTLSEIGIDDISAPNEEAVKKYVLFTGC